MATSHETFAENTCHSLKYCTLRKEIFKTECYQEPLASFNEVAQFECFDESIRKHDRGGEYGLEGNVWVMKQHEEVESSSFGLNIVSNSTSSTFVFERIWFNLQFCVKTWKKIQPAISKVVFDVVMSHWKAKKSNPSNEVKVDTSKRRVNYTSPKWNSFVETHINE